MFNSVQSVCNLKYTIKIAFLQQINNFAPENELKIFRYNILTFLMFSFRKSIFVGLSLPIIYMYTFVFIPHMNRVHFFTLQSSECSILLKYFALTNRRSPYPQRERITIRQISSPTE